MATTVWADADGARALAPAPQWTHFRSVGPQTKLRIPVFDQRIGAIGWLDAPAVGPSGPPPASGVVAGAVAIGVTPPVESAAQPGPPADPGSRTASVPAAVASTAAGGVTEGAAKIIGSPASRRPHELTPGVRADGGRWVQNHMATVMWVGAQGDAQVSAVAQWTFVQWTGPQVGMRIPVLEPKTGRQGWLDALAVGPTGPPPDVAPDPPTPPQAVPAGVAPISVERPGPEVAARDLPRPAEPRSEPRSRPTDAPVMLPAPVTPPAGLAPTERWIDVDLAQQRLRLVEGQRVVHTAPVTTGKTGFVTPTGTFRIFYRVDNETMDSQTTGVPRGSVEGYLLKEVRYTQYFAEGGFALHHNYWQPGHVFGKVPTSHGCIGMQLDDAAAVWTFASHGTVVHIH